MQKLHLDVQMGDHPIDHSVERTKDNMETLERSLNQLIGHIMYISRQQEFQRVNAN